MQSDVRSTMTCYWAEFEVESSNNDMSQNRLLGRYGHFKN
jgi:hypothetical protein